MDFLGWNDSSCVLILATKKLSLDMVRLMMSAAGGVDKSKGGGRELELRSIQSRFFFFRGVTENSLVGR